MASGITHDGRPQPVPKKLGEGAQAGLEMVRHGEDVIKRDSRPSAWGTGARAVLCAAAQGPGRAARPRGRCQGKGLEPVFAVHLTLRPFSGRPSFGSDISNLPDVSWGSSC